MTQHEGEKLQDFGQRLIEQRKNELQELIDLVAAWKKSRGRD